MTITENNDITMIRGDTERLLVGCKNYEFQDGDIVEITVRKKASDPVMHIYKKIESFDDGKARVVFAPDDTSSLSPGRYVYDVQLTTADGDVKTIIECSMIELKQDVTYA